MIYRKYFNPSVEMGLTPATKRLLAAKDAEPGDTDERFYEAICAPVVDVPPDIRAEGPKKISLAKKAPKNPVRAAALVDFVKHLAQIPK